MSTLKDLTGQRFGRLYVVSRAEDRIGKNGRHRVTWKCECDCGNEIIVDGDALKRGATKSCGCYRKEASHINHSTHGMRESKIYGVWAGIKARCYNKNHHAYKNYGGRGIRMCDSWKKDFTSFYDWAMDSGYEEGLTIDRINNNGNYEPENCRWVDNKIQANNRRSNRKITYKGETHNITEWAKILNKPSKTLFNRVYVGWNDEDIITK